MTALLTPYRSLFANWRRIAALTRHDLMSRYVRNTFGMFWVFAFPALFLGIYSYTYLYIFKVASTVFPADIFILVIFGALIPFISFQESFQGGAASVVSSAHLVQTTLFPVETLPVRTVLSSLPVLIIGLAGLVIALPFTAKLHVTLLLLPVAVLLQIVFMIGIAWLAATITIFFRDFIQISGLVSILLMLLSPLGFTREQIPDKLGVFCLLNPLYYMIEFYRDVMFRGSIDTTIAVAWIAIAFGTFHLGHFVFSRLRPMFASHV
jgi:lipopolysaccharide transport system permease protein